METYSRAQQNDYFDPGAMENIKKYSKKDFDGTNVSKYRSIINSFARVYKLLICSRQLFGISFVILGEFVWRRWVDKECQPS